MESRPARNHTQDFADFIESNGAAISPVAKAFFGRKERMAKDRFYWMFPPDKDRRVASLLAWIQSVSNGLGSFGLHKFLQTRERGALIVNANFQPSESPNEPAFDWLTYPELQKTMDRTLQESVAFYDPSALVVVFVFLPSKSGKSLAIWRRKIAVPSNVRLAYQAQITQAIDSLKRDYEIHVDEYVTLAGLNFDRLTFVTGYLPLNPNLPTLLQRNASGGSCGYLREHLLLYICIPFLCGTCISLGPLGIFDVVSF
ncbi:hypothetical protein EDB19DRAFT_1624889 [Suillus lakei]|nr:hypothetical protein EDB19DRAFT_1624889 [Suillus lakei]